MNEKNIRDSFQKIEDSIGLVHVLVNNAGITTSNDRSFPSISMKLIATSCLNIN